MRVQWKKTIPLLGVQWKFPIALLENGTFYLISRDHNQPIKRPEFNKVLYNPRISLTPLYKNRISRSSVEFEIMYHASDVTSIKFEFVYPRADLQC